MVFNVTFNNAISVTVCHDGQLYWRRTPEYMRKPPTCRKSLTNFPT